MIAILAVWPSRMTGCETMKGLGRDVEDAGEWVQEKVS